MSPLPFEEGRGLRYPAKDHGVSLGVQVAWNELGHEFG